MADIEAVRLANIAAKEKLLAGFNLNSNTTTTVISRVIKQDSDTSPPPSKKRKFTTTINSTPTRSSARLQNVPAPSYKDEIKLFELVDRPTRASRPSARSRTGPELPQHPVDDINPATDIDKIRAGWTSWEATQPQPTRGRDGTFYFADAEDFTPNLSPAEMLRQGAFGGTYFRPLKSAKLGIVVRDDWQELPDDWISQLDVDKYLVSPVYNAKVNKYKVACGQTIEEWEAAGWIDHRSDVRGWFQWYCRYFQGRRCRDDARQISRWKKCVGDKGRWKTMLLKRYKVAAVRAVCAPADDGEMEVSPVMHQTCHHWAYEMKQTDLDQAWRLG